MIKASINEFGQLFPNAVVAIEKIVIRRSPTAKSGYVIVAITKAWASKEAMNNNAQHIKSITHIISECEESAAPAGHVSMSKIVDGKAGLCIIEDIEEALLTLPQFVGATII